MATDPYLIPGTSVLANKLGLKDEAALAKAEAHYSTGRIHQMIKAPIRGKFDLQHLKAIHRHIFQDVYSWAGQLRTIRMGKAEPTLGGKSIHYPDPHAAFPPDNLQARADYAFDALARDDFLSGLSRRAFVEKFARHATEIWEVHPFREGNTRATLTFMHQVADAAGHPMQAGLADQPRAVRDAFVRAAASSDYEPLKTMVARSLTRERDLVGELSAIKQADPARYARLSGLAREAEITAKVRFSDRASRQHYVAEKLGKAIDSDQAAAERPSRELGRSRDCTRDEYGL